MKDKNKIKVLRRTGAIDELVDLRLKKPFTFDICDYDRDGGWLLDFIIVSVNEVLDSAISVSIGIAAPSTT